MKLRRLQRCLVLTMHGKVLAPFLKSALRDSRENSSIEVRDRSMLDISTSSTPLFALGEDQIAVRDMARVFATDVFAPNAVAWDETKHFPVAEMRRAAELGMGGVYVSADVGGSALSRLDAALIFEALATGCPTVAGDMSIHNTADW